jgi:hypothetical protein
MITYMNVEKNIKNYKIKKEIVNLIDFSWTTDAIPLLSFQFRFSSDLRSYKKQFFKKR